jgi:hypothetical protein
VKIDHSHEEIHSGAMSQNQEQRIYGTNVVKKLSYASMNVFRLVQYVGYEHKICDACTLPKVFKTIHHGTSLYHENRCVGVKHSETPFDYRSLMYNIKKFDTTHR